MSVDGMPLPAWKHSRPGGTGYPADAQAWDRWYASAAYGWSPASSTVRSALNGLTPGRALDLGSGDGRHAVWLAGRGWHVQALDFSAEALALGRERAFAEGVTGLVTWTVAEVTVHTPDPASLDLVLAAFLDLPGPDLERVIARAALALAPGGIFLFIGHDPEDPREGATGPRDQSMLHGSTEVAAWARRSGLEVESAETLSRPVPGDRRPALDCVLLARKPARAPDVPAFNTPLSTRNTDHKVPS
ncbi:class I SAM-dependent methyltransferase [Pseudarthrobacter sp. MDT3-26]|uniref:class I SAM-dependent methyltransferase n=1 Tax=Pseudarthrobacter raffinosi TaxID=2953651 RepID=UPI00208F4F2A|nr:class I SAM-dependent methyltransferase [Pseudarthrobacter sp. MDT3-26]MCO4264371.1 class I SAM-dependent methyltransferase [Pseudarthrobacter sp. MDT3-26]